MLDWWTYDRLLTFVYAADGGLYYAARCLERSIAQISTDLHRWEFLGKDRLFSIKEDRLVLTTEGQRFFAQMKPLLEQIDAIYRDVASERILPTAGTKATQKSERQPKKCSRDRQDVTAKKPWWRFW